jgi:predicted NBD/HSP70 family sugar kinase
LLERGTTTKGKVGKPSVPMRLAADGVLSLGLKIGRRTADLILMDFHGQVRHEISTTYAYPLPRDIYTFLNDGLHEILSGLSADAARRICGLGIAAPFELWNWTDQLGASTDEFQGWRDVDFLTMAASLTDFPVSLINDATAACQAEQVFGRGKEFRDFAYYYIGVFIGGGIVLNHSLFEGHQRNAGALGSLRTIGPDGENRQLIDTASLYLLENRIIAAGFDRTALWAMPQDWSTFDDLVGEWIDQTAEEIARASLSACAIIDFEAILIDGVFPDHVKDRLVAQARVALAKLDSRGLIVPVIERGSVGVNARAIGAASHPVFSRFLLNTNASPGS